jgi:hypothetical protein
MLTNSMLMQKILSNMALLEQIVFAYVWLPSPLLVITSVVIFREEKTFSRNVFVILLK